MPIKPISNSKYNLKSKNFSDIVSKLIFWAIEILWIFFSDLLLSSQLLIVCSKEHSHVHALTDKCFY